MYILNAVPFKTFCTWSILVKSRNNTRIPTVKHCLKENLNCPVFVMHYKNQNNEVHTKFFFLFQLTT